MAIITTKYTGKMLFAATEKLPSSREDFKITNTILIIVTKIINSAFFIFFLQNSFIYKLHKKQI